MSEFSWFWYAVIIWKIFEERITIHINIFIKYIRCLILITSGKYLEKYEIFEETFQTKVVGYQGERNIFVWSWRIEISEDKYCSLKAIYQVSLEYLKKFYANKKNVLDDNYSNSLIAKIIQ